MESVRALRELPLAESGKSIPVELKGIITHSDPVTGSFLSDGSEGIFLQTNRSKPPLVLTPGDQVEVSGLTDPGGFISMVVPRADARAFVRVTGKSPLPPAQPVNGSILARPDTDSRYVTLQAYVSEVFVNEGFVTLKCLADNCLFHATLNVEKSKPRIPWELAEHRVQLRGVVATAFNAQRQMTLRLLRISDLSDIEMIREGGPDNGVPRPSRTDDLLRAGGAGPSDLVVLRGVATLIQSGRGLFMRTDEGSLWVQTAQPVAAVLGTVLSVEGWPRVGPVKPYVSARRIIFEGASAPPAPVPLTAANAASPRYDSELVSVEAELLDVLRGPETVTLELRDGSTVFRSFLSDEKTFPDRLVPGMRLRITGIVQSPSPLRFQPLQETGKLLLRLRAPEDLEVLAQPTPWTARNVLTASGLLLSVILGFLAMAHSRRRREREAQRREFEAVLAERGRFAREIHDSLAQGLTSISLQLECVRQELRTHPDRASEHVELARVMVRDSMREARRTVWNLRPLALGQNDLTGALQRLGTELTKGSEVFFSLEIDGTPRTLPETHETTFLRIGQEALTNAIRHAAAKNIKITLRYDHEWVTLVISDDGKGFDLAQTRPTSSGGFGLPGMRERVEPLGGSLTIDSHPGEGTEVSATLPLNP